VKGEVQALWGGGGRWSVDGKTTSEEDRSQSTQRLFVNRMRDVAGGGVAERLFSRQYDEQLRARGIRPMVIAVWYTRNRSSRHKRKSLWGRGAEARELRKTRQNGRDCLQREREGRSFRRKSRRRMRELTRNAR